ncbi:FecR family protein [Novosphingobium rosa]|uniref:FecR family protein n=1 Tax=Novosphingobium rosa TaxID=76978 RepID=UPI00082A26DA|nr:FecR domain-containing protein [Novosphingobium rosa]
MTETASDLTETALRWHIRLRNGGDADWDAFADWLAQNPDHAEAYAEVEAMDHALDSALPDLHFPAPQPAEPQPVAANDDAPAPARRWRWAAGAGGALAAGLVLALVGGPFGEHGSSRYQITTAPGESRTIDLDAGTQITLNGDTQMVFDRKDARFARLDHGEALFAVQHDTQHPFTLEMGTSRIVDIGTLFNVVSLPDQTRIAVAEGAVDYRPDGQSIPLHAGQQMQADTAAGTARVSPIDHDTVGSWRHRRLSYDGSPLEQVAQDLGRVLGAAIRVDARIAHRPVFGTIDVQDITPVRIPLLASALNVRVVKQGKTWILKPAHGPTP